LPPIAWVGMAIIVASGLLAKRADKKIQATLAKSSAEAD
jgi:hypothetical protein